MRNCNRIFGVHECQHCPSLLSSIIINHHQSSLFSISHHQSSSIIIHHHPSSSIIIIIIIIIISHHGHHYYHQSSSVIIITITNHHESSAIIIKHHQASSIIISHDQSSSIIIISFHCVAVSFLSLFPHPPLQPLGDKKSVQLLGGSCNSTFELSKSPNTFPSPPNQQPLVKQCVQLQTCFNGELLKRNRLLD